MNRYNQGVIGHGDSQNPTLEEMIKLRRDSNGAEPIYHLVEYAHNLQVPDEVMRNPVIKELETLGMDMVFM